MTGCALPDLLVEPVVRRALEEDLGRAGDITTDALVPAGLTARAAVRRAGAGRGRRHPGGVDRVPSDGPGGDLRDRHRRRWKGRAGRCGAAGRGTGAGDPLGGNGSRSTLLCRLSGIATATAGMVAAVRAAQGAHHLHPARPPPACARWREAAVRAGVRGRTNRFGLDDAVLIKDNHVALAGGRGAGGATGPRRGRPPGQDRGGGRHPSTSWPRR